MQQCCSSAGRCTWFAIGRLTWRTLRTPLPKCTEPWILSLFLLSSLRMLEGGRIEKRGETFSTNVSFVVNSFSLEGSRLSPSHDTNNMNNSMMKFIFFFIFLVYHRIIIIILVSLRRLGKIVNPVLQLVDERRRSNEVEKICVCVCTNLGNSTAPRCTFRFRDTDLPRKCRCARPPNRNYDNCTCNRHEWAKECHPTGRITSDSKEDSMGWISLTRINGADEKRTMTILKNVS